MKSCNNPEEETKLILMRRATFWNSEQSMIEHSLGVTESFRSSNTMEVKPHQTWCKVSFLNTEPRVLVDLHNWQPQNILISVNVMLSYISINIEWGEKLCFVLEDPHSNMLACVRFYSFSKTHCVSTIFTCDFLLVSRRHKTTETRCLVSETYWETDPWLSLIWPWYDTITLKHQNW